MPNMCFADFEFTCGGNIHRYGCEMLSVGIVVCDSMYNIQEQFYRTARPVHFSKMTKQCQKLTGLKQLEIDFSPDSNTVLKEVVSIMKKYDVNSLYVWGNFDSPGLLSDIKQHKIKRRTCTSIKKVQSAVTNIQDYMTEKMELPQIVSIKDLANAFSYQPPGKFHNALNDTMALYTIHRLVHTTDFKNNEKFLSLKRERIEKIEQAKREALNKRMETFLSIKLSENENNYYNKICSEENSDAMDSFINIRIKFIRAFEKYPNDNNFVFIRYDEKNNIKIVPQSKYKHSNLERNAVKFSKEQFSQVVVNECSKTAVY